MRRLLPVALLLAPHLARANPIWAQELDPSTVASGKAEIVKLLQQEGEDLELADVRLKFDVLSTSDDTGCPGLDVEVFNAMDHTAWAVEVTLNQKLGAKKRSDIIHLPYLPAKTQVKVTVECVENYTTRYSYSYSSNSDPIDFDYSAKSVRTLPEAMKAMIDTKADASLESITITPKPSNQTLMEQALAINDRQMAHELVTAIASTGIGAKELGVALAKKGALAGPNLLAEEVAGSLAKLPAAQQAKLARVLLASPQATQWADRLGPLLDTKLCSGARPDVVALWMMAQTPGGIPVDELRAKVAAKCTLLPSDGAALVTALEGAPMYASALDKVDAPMFASVVAAWRASKAPVSYSLPGFLATTGDTARFDTAAALVSDKQVFATIVAMAQGEPTDVAEKSEASAHRAAWMAKAATKLGLDDQDDLVRDLFGKLVDGRVKDPAMRKAVRELRDLQPAAADGVVAAYTKDHSKVYDAQKLGDAKLDLLDYLAFSSTELADCSSNLEALSGCATAIAKRPELIKQGDAIKSDFRSVIDQLMSAAPKGEMVETAKLLDAAGISITPQVDHLCSEIRDALRWNGDYETPLGFVKQIPHGESCVAAIGDEAASKHRTVIIMTILAICGLVLPFPIGGYFLRRRWRKFTASIPTVSAADANAGTRLEDRLGAAGLGNALASAVSEARRETNLAGLAVVDQAMVERAAATVRRAVKAGDAASALAKIGGQMIYVLALPVRNARPQVVQRYLGAEWPDHLDAVFAAAGAPVTALVILCDATASEATLLVGFTDGTNRSDPDALLDAREARERNANTFRGVMSLAVAKGAA